MSGRDNVSVQEWLLNPCYSYALPPLNELYRGKLVSSIIVNIQIYILGWPFIAAYHLL